MSTPGGPLPSFESSRRNLMRVGAIAASALLAKATTAVAEENREGWRFMDWERDRHRDRDRDDDDDRKPRHCFLRGTTIRAVDGDRKIEELVVGDVLPTVFG